MVMGDLVRGVDVVVVGGGPGGYSAAFRCAELGLETLVVDAGKRLGGACLYEGCIPSKALLHVAAVLAEAERAKEFGVDFGEPRIAIDATGSAPAALPGIAVTSDRVMDSTAALEIPDIPERLLVIGGGYIGLELGQVYAALGSAVTLVEMTDGLLPGADRDLVQWLGRRVDKQFAAIRLNARIDALRETASGVEGTIAGAATTFDRALFAVGRRALTDGLGLDKTRARQDARGFVQID